MRSEGAGMTFVHWSRAPIARVRDRVADIGVEPDHKPKGLWLSDESRDDGWFSWCTSEGMEDWLHPYVYEVDVDPDAVLLIDNLAALDRFHREWRGERWPDSRYTQWGIRWADVARRYDGVIIAPYQGYRRLDGDVSDWYYPWDCASGCIWRARAITRIAPFAEAAA